MHALDITDVRRGINPAFYDQPNQGRSASTLLKAAKPQKITDIICEGIDRALRYLGLVEPCKGLNASPSLKTLRVKGYILALPTSAQLRLVMKGEEQNEATPAAMDSVCEALDRHHELLEMLAEIPNCINDSPETAQLIAEKEIESQLGELDKTLEQATAAFGHKDSGAFLALRNGLRDAEALRGLRTDWRYWEMLGVSPAEYDDVWANPDSIDNWLEIGFSAKEALSFKNAGFTPEQVAHLRGTGVTGPIARQMDLFGYSSNFFPQEVDTQRRLVSIAKYGFTLGNHHDAWAENPAVAIGSGAFNTPMVGYFPILDRPCTSQEAVDERVFKKEKYLAQRLSPNSIKENITQLQLGQILPKSSSQTGLEALVARDMVSDASLSAPRIGLRNVMASNLAEAMGLTVIVKTEFSARTTPLNPAEIKRHSLPVDQQHSTFDFGISMQRVVGRYGQIDGVIELPSDSEKKKTMIEELIDLQLFDIFIGQIDRHRGNIIIDENGHVFGIDNDQCFPDKNGAEIERLVYDKTCWDPQFQKGVHLPNVVTEKQKERWLGYDEKTLLKAMPFATKEQKEFAIQRLKIIKTHISKLPEENIVSRDALATWQVGQLLCTPREFKGHDGRKGMGYTSYFGVMKA